MKLMRRNGEELSAVHRFLKSQVGGGAIDLPID